MDKVHQQRDVADKMERLEHQSRINDAINDSVKREEQKVIEAANKRMAEVHSRKAEEANSASKAVEAAKSARIAAESAARKAENDAINRITSTSAGNVVA